MSPLCGKHALIDHSALREADSMSRSEGSTPSDPKTQQSSGLQKPPFPKTQKRKTPLNPTRAAARFTP
jgi:hypothetical protein